MMNLVELGLGILFILFVFVIYQLNNLMVLIDDLRNGKNYKSFQKEFVSGYEFEIIPKNGPVKIDVGSLNDFSLLVNGNRATFDPKVEPFLAVRLMVIERVSMRIEKGKATLMANVVDKQNTTFSVVDHRLKWMLFRRLLSFGLLDLGVLLLGLKLVGVL